MTTTSNHWPGLGITDDLLEEKAEWLGRDHQRFPGHLLLFFRTAAGLLRFTRQDFTVLPLVFVQSVVGLEKVLRLIYDTGSQRLKLREMLQRAIDDGFFANLEILPWKQLPRYMNFEWAAELPQDPLERLAVLIPRLRNEFVHGNYFLCPEILELVLQVRRMVDVLVPHLPPSWTEQNDACFDKSEASKAEDLTC